MLITCIWRTKLGLCFSKKKVIKLKFLLLNLFSAYHISFAISVFSLCFSPPRLNSTWSDPWKRFSSLTVSPRFSLPSPIQHWLPQYEWNNFSIKKNTFTRPSTFKSSEKLWVRIIVAILGVMKHRCPGKTGSIGFLAVTPIDKFQISYVPPMSSSSIFRVQT